MNVVTRALIDSVSWATLRTDSGSGADLPRAFADLAVATTPEGARAAYWRIDNEVVVQGELHEAALPALAVLLSMAATTPPDPVRRAVAELIQQIACGQARASEVELGNVDLAARCRALTGQATWLCYGWLADGDSQVRECALLTLHQVETDEARRAAVFGAVRDTDPDPGVQKILRQLAVG